MTFLIAEIFFGFLGWTYLFFKYRDIKKMTSAKNDEFDGAYSTAGRTIILHAFLVLIGVLCIGLIIAGLIGTIKNS